MPKHPGVTSGDNDKEINDEQNIPWLLLKDGVGLTYRFRAAVARNTKNSFREDPREGGFTLTVPHRLGHYSNTSSRPGQPARRAKHLHSASYLQLLLSWTGTCPPSPQI